MLLSIYSDALQHKGPSHLYQFSILAAYTMQLTVFLVCSTKSATLSFHELVCIAGREVLAWPADAVVSPALSLQLHCLAEPALLKGLVQQALPVPALPASQAAPQQAGTVHSLCQMLQALTGVSALCQKALIFTAGPADFVQRLWTSHLKVVLLLLCLHIILS